MMLAPKGHLAMSGNVFGCHNWGVLLATSGQRAEILLNIQQSTRQLLTTKKDPTRNANTVEVEKTWSTPNVLNIINS